MFDFIYLFILPLVIAGVVALIIAAVLNERSKNNSKKVRIHNIAAQPRNVHDTNHKRSKIEKLMNPKSDETFCNAYKFLIKNSLSNIDTD